MLTVLVTNVPPVANPDSYTVAENSSANVLNPLTNDLVQTPGGTLNIISVSPTNGTAVISGTNVLFTPSLNFTGTATIGYTITDNAGGTNTSLITVTVSNPSADVAVGGTNSPVATYTENLVYDLSVTNLGPNAATGVVVSNRIPAGILFVSATDGATPANGVLLLNFGALAVGAVSNVMITLTPTNYVPGFLTNVFQVSANEADPMPANNSAAFITQLELPTTEFTTSTAEYDTNHTMAVSQQVTNFSTELIARLPDGTVVYDQTFTAAFSDPTVQAAITTAAGDLTGAGASSYSGPVQTGVLTTTNNSSITGPNSTNITLITGTKQWVGPVTFPAGNFGIVTGYTFDLVNTNYPIPTGGNPQPFTLGPGQTDFDTMVLSVFDIFLTTTNTATYTNSSAYVMTGVTPLYTIKDLGTLTGTNSQAMAINNFGQIVGKATLLGGAYHAAFWTNVLAPPVQLGRPKRFLGERCLWHQQSR